MKRVRIFSALIARVCMCCALSANVYAYDILDRTATLDNDTSMSGYSNSGNFNILYGSEFTNGSARIQSSPMSSSYYRWNFPTLHHDFVNPEPQVELVVHAFVNSDSFEDYATYTVNVAHGGYYNADGIVHLFQKYCHSGWYTMSKNVSGAVGGQDGYNPNFVKVNPSGYWGPNNDHSEVRYCGADSIWVGFRYTDQTV